MDSFFFGMPFNQEPQNRPRFVPLRTLRKDKREAIRSYAKFFAVSQFVATAVAEKLSALQVAEFFADRKARADFKAFDKIMKRRGGKPPRAGNQMPR
jgi:hypothetical protein